MADDKTKQLQLIRRYHSDRGSLYHAERGPSIFGLADNPSFACVCAELARLAYTRFENNPPIQQQLARTVAAGGFGPPVFFDIEGAQAFALRAPNGQPFVTFRGTQPDDLLDLIHDLEFLPLKKAAYPGMVDQGFAEAFEPLWPALHDWLGSQPSALPPVLTGHSLGAALATLGAARVEKAHLVTFGSPRVGNVEFAESFAGRMVERYVDCCDGVTLVPLEEGFGYKHVGLMTYIDRDGKIQRPLPSPRAVDADRLRARLRYPVIDPFSPNKVLARDLADHAPANYIRALLAP